MNSLFPAIGLLLAFTAIGAEQELYFPPADGQWEKAKSVRLDPKKLQKALDYAGKQNSTGVVILHRGRILAEQYWNLDGEGSAKFNRRIIGRTENGGSIEDVASAQKSVVSVLVGIAQEKGLLKIDDRVDKYLGSGWSKAKSEQEKLITIRHLITMTSGLTERGTYEARAGKKWKYNTTVYAKTVDVLEKASGMDRHELTRKWLTAPLGMKDSKWAPRNSAELQSVNAFGFATSARDLARFGLMVFAKGKWGEETILGDQKYLKDSTTTSQNLQPYYGYLWWVNQNANKPRERRTATIPRDAFSANGALNRRCWVVPSQQLVVTRIGDQPSAKRGFDQEFWRLLRESARKR
ncbi:MAG: serine hydrolase domain-containing protein [Limisphaerales bacterium]